MIAFIFTNLIFFSWAHDYSTQIIGEWKAIGYFYEGNFIQPPDPQVTMIFEFFTDGTHRLYWKLKTEKTFCERKGLWYLKEDQLFNEVTWVNPENGSDCFSDPDMQKGKKTQSKIEIKEDQLLLEIPFVESVIIYVWDRVTKTEL